VKAIVNKMSNHLFQNTKEAEIVIGGAQRGANEVQLNIKTLPGGLGNEPLAVRIYAFSQVKGVKPEIVYEYIVEEKGSVKGTQTIRFEIDQATLSKLSGR